MTWHLIDSLRGGYSLLKSLFVAFGFPVIVKDQAYRQRKKQRPNLPKTISDVNISSYTDLVTTKRGKPFYRGKSKETGGELFMSDIQIDIAAAADSIFIDGTFSIVPAPFYQVLFIVAKVGENTYPIATALLPNK